MTPEAIIMLVAAILLVWGGFVGACVNLFRRPDRSVNDEAPSVSEVQ